MNWLDTMGTWTSIPVVSDQSTLGNVLIVVEVRIGFVESTFPQLVAYLFGELFVFGEGFDCYELQV